MRNKWDKIRQNEEKETKYDKMGENHRDRN